MLPVTLQFLIAMIAAAINDRLQRKLDYVEEERRVQQEWRRSSWKAPWRSRQLPWPLLRSA